MTFPSDTSHCAALGSAGQALIFTSPGTSTGRAVGFVLVDQMSGGATWGGGQPTGSTLLVESYQFDGTQVDNAFKVAVFC